MLTDWTSLPPSARIDRDTTTAATEVVDTPAAASEDTKGKGKGKAVEVSRMSRSERERRLEKGEPGRSELVAAVLLRNLERDNARGGVP